MSVRESETLAETNALGEAVTNAHVLWFRFRQLSPMEAEIDKSMALPILGEFASIQKKKH